MAVARHRAAAERLNIEYTIGDAERLPFEAETFDAVLSTFGVMFVSRPEAAAAEIGRVCRKGGRVALTTWLPDSSVTNYYGPNGEAAWKAFVMGYGPTKALAAGLDETRRAELKRAFVAFHDGFPAELGICVPRQYLLTLGVRK